MSKQNNNKCTKGWRNKPQALNKSVSLEHKYIRSHAD